MAYLGWYNIGEQIRFYANWVKLDGTPQTGLSTVEYTVYRNGSVFQATASMTVHPSRSNLYYADFTVPASTVEDTYKVVYTAQLDGEERSGSDMFQVNEIKELVKELRLGNQRFEFFCATVQDTVRNVEIGVLDRQIIYTKRDDDADWSSPVSTKTLYFWYENLGDFNPIRVGEDG